MQRASAAVSLVMTALLGTLAHPSYAQDPCAAFKWNVAHERALFAGAPERLAAGPDRGSAPQLLPDHLYGLSLLPQERITLSVPLGRKAQFDGAFGGLARLHVPRAATLSDRARSARMDRRRGRARCYTVERLCRRQCLQRAAQAGAIRAAGRGTVAAAERRRHRGYQANTDPGPRTLACLGACPRGSMSVSLRCAAKR